MGEGEFILTCGHTNMPLVGVWEPETDERGNRCRSYSTYCPACAEEATRVMVGRIEELEAKVKEARQRGYAQAAEDAAKKADKLAAAVQGDADAVRNTHPQFADDRSEYADDVRDLANEIRTLTPSTPAPVTVQEAARVSRRDDW